MIIAGLDNFVKRISFNNVENNNNKMANIQLNIYLILVYSDY